MPPPTQGHGAEATNSESPRDPIFVFVKLRATQVMPLALFLLVYFSDRVLPNLP
jgi:hypothetical protein